MTTVSRYAGVMLLAIFLAVSSSTVASAQSSVNATAVSGGVSAGAATSIMPCYSFPRGMYFGSRGSEVINLQQFLASNGYFTAGATGFFGPLTFRAVQSFQADNGIAAVGSVGPLTRAAIARIWCRPILPPQREVFLRTMDPASGPVGTQVTLKGNGFTRDNTIVFGSGVVMNVPSYDGSTLTFTVPDGISPRCFYSNPRCLMASQQTMTGNYGISVENTNGTSNSIVFVVTSANVGGTLSVNGLDAPSSLSMGASGTWTVRATSNGVGNLHYSAHWGDEVYAEAQASLMYPGPREVQNSATFTHAYQRAGTYTATFTVTDDYGQSAQVSSTVTITPWY